MQKRKPLPEKAQKLRIKAGIRPSEKPALSKRKQERLNYELLGAAEAGKNDEIRRLLKAGADIAARDYGRMALHLAAMNGRTETCVFLISEFAKAEGDARLFISAKDKTGRAALSHAAYYGHAKACALLIKEYADAGGDVKTLIAAKDNEGWTALFNAASSEHAKACIILLSEYAKAGGDVKGLISVEAIGGWTPLNYAIAAKHVRTAKFFKSIPVFHDWLGDKTFVSFMDSFNGCISQ